MRIISGSAKGRTIIAPKGNTTRPTSDRIKESLFAIIQGMISDSDVLDLFSGSGNLGLESLSRGARTAVFIDKDKTSVDIIKKNIALLGVESSTRVYQADYMKALNRLKKNGETFDLIFLDPPYQKGLLLPAIDTIFHNHILKEGGLVIAEHYSNEYINDTPHIYKVRDRRRFGITAISFIIKDVNDE